MVMFEASSLPVDALRRALERAGAEERAAVLADMGRAADRLVSVLRGSYPQGATGNLRKGVSKRTATTFGYVVRSVAKHVHFIEQGTRQRFDSTRKGANRGRMQATPIFIPNAIRERQSFLRAAQSRLSRHRVIA